MNSVWLKGEYEFAALFSYRVPNFSTAFAPSAPLPGPSAVKLALVSTRIEATGEVAEGKDLFEKVKSAQIGLEPATLLTMSRTFLRRLKRMKNGDLGQSFAIREYVHHGSPISLYLEVASDAVDLIADTMRRLRRIGTSDSLLYCRNVSEDTPDPMLIAQPMERFMMTQEPKELIGRPVLPLRDIKAKASFKDVNPYQRSTKDFTVQRFYIFPLRQDGQGEGWTRYRRDPFVSIPR